jgi:hypothetical protein
LSPNFGPDKVNSYTLGIERELTKNAALEVRYSGNRAYDLFQSVNANPFIADLKTDFPNLVPANLTPCAATQQIGPGAGTDVGRVNCGIGVDRSRDNTGYSYYNGVQVELRANNLFKQLTLRTGYTFSKTLDNVSEIFSTFGGGNSVAFAQNPLDIGRGEYSFSGLDIPHQWTVLFTEELPFFKEQHGFAGHLLGGWAISGNYILSSGERYTPSQIAVTQLTEGGNYFDSAFFSAFNGGVELARPFLGNPNAPVTSVGIFASDACSEFGDAGVCALAPTQLISLNALNASSPGQPFNVVNQTKNDVRFIANGQQAATLFGTPFGNTPRNNLQDAITNVGNVSIFKKIRFTERTSFEFHASMLNVFNHFNFSSVDPFIDDAGLHTSFTGFGDPSTTGGTGRKIFVGGKISF